MFSILSRQLRAVTSLLMLVNDTDSSLPFTSHSYCPRAFVKKNIQWERSICQLDLVNIARVKFEKLKEMDRLEEQHKQSMENLGKERREESFSFFLTWSREEPEVCAQEGLHPLG